jgi:arylsulfatase
MPYFRGDTEEGPRKEFFYFNDGGDLVNLRYDRWKLVFAEQRAEGFEVWEEPFVPLRVPKLIDLYSDPFERAQEEAAGYTMWRFERLYLLVPAQVFVGKFLETFKDYPPRQAPASFSIDQVLSSLQRNQGG